MLQQRQTYTETARNIGGRFVLQTEGLHSDVAADSVHLPTVLTAKAVTDKRRSYAASMARTPAVGLSSATVSTARCHGLSLGLTRSFAVTKRLRIQVFWDAELCV